VTTAAVITLVLACLVLFGGLVVSVGTAVRSERRARREVR
jgi:hypothetical protein